MVKQGLYIYAWPLIFWWGGWLIIKLFDKLTVKPNLFCRIEISDGVSSESAAAGFEYAQPGWLENLFLSVLILPALSVRMLESVEPFSKRPVF